MSTDDGSGNKNTLNNPAMDSGLQSNVTQEKQVPAFANEAQLLAAKNAPIGTPENQIQDDSIGQESGESYFNDPRKPVGYVEQPKKETYTAPQQIVRVSDVHNEQQHAGAQQQLNLQVIAQRHQESLNQDSPQAMSKQGVLVFLQEQNRPNLAGRFAAMSAHVESSQMTDENKVDAQQRLNKATLAYAGRVEDKEILPIDIRVAQQVNDKNLELG